MDSYLAKVANIRGGGEATEEVGNPIRPNTAHLRMKELELPESEGNISRGGRRPVSISYLVLLGAAAGTRL